MRAGDPAAHGGLPGRVVIPLMDRSVSCVMAAPSSAAPETTGDGLDFFRAMGGDCVHLHGEGGETETRVLTGWWLSARSLRDSFVLCTQICHDEWDADAQLAVSRFNAAAVEAEISGDLERLRTDSIDLVYLDDHPSLPMEPVLEALSREERLGRIRAVGLRNWTPDRVRAAAAISSREGGPTFAALITTELSLLRATEPLWPDYVPFDRELEQVAMDLQLAVFAHASDMTIGQCVFGDEELAGRWRQEWIGRWNHAQNGAIGGEIQAIASERGLTTREVSLAWMLHRPYPTVLIVGTPALLGMHATQYTRLSDIRLESSELERLNRARLETAK